jgi:hypothetical protein
MRIDEMFIVKWTFAVVFVGVTIVFLVKIGGLLVTAGGIKLAAFLKAHPWIETLGKAVAK